VKRLPRRLLQPIEVANAVQRRYILRRAEPLGLVAYVPWFDHRAQLAAQTQFVEDSRPVRDKRPTTAAGAVADLTITVEGLEDVLSGRELRGRRVLEVGPKYGIHSLWLDEHLSPSEIVFSDFASDRPLHEEWESRLQSPHRFVYGDLRTADELTELEPFDLVLFLGVLYHSAHHLPLLAMLNRVTALGGSMLVETTVDSRPDASVRLRWLPESAKAKAVPTVEALRLMLAWTGFRRVTRFTDYRPGSTEAIFLCEKTDELADDTQLAPVVTAHRPAAQA
jgi:2-polyprenyl-3-methyl-5-hydroxy-6-metoxy-1,4-benzoquinol methylase